MAVLPHAGSPAFETVANVGSFIPRSVVLASLSAQPCYRNSRKNYLRPKLLRLSHPLLHRRPLQDSLPPIELEEFKTSSDHASGAQDEPKFHEACNSQSSEASVIVNNDVISNVMEQFYGSLPFPKHVLLAGLFLINICFAVLLMLPDPKNTESESFDSNEDGNKKLLMSENEVKGSNLDIDGAGNRKSLLDKNAENLPLRESGDVKQMDKIEVEEKISQIREMARAVRRSEMKVGKGEAASSPSDNSQDGDIIIGTSGRRNHVEKEIDAELIMMQERLKYLGKQSLVSFDSCLSNPEIPENGELGVKKDKAVEKDKDGCENSVLSKDFPGEQISEDTNVTGSDRLDHMENKSKNQDENPDLSEISRNDGKLKHEDVMGTGDIPRKTQIKTGSIPQPRHDKISAEMMKMQHSLDMMSHVSRNNTGENTASGLTNKECLRGTNRQINQGSRGENSSVVLSKQPDVNDIWWSGLDYVVAIHMTTKYDSEAEGLFILRPYTATQDPIGVPYIVAFEYRADALNFCYILWTYFQKLTDFDAGAVVMSIDEMEEARVSNAASVFVVRKRQLKIYAGQPFPEVENILRSLVLQNKVQKVSSGR